MLDIMFIVAWLLVAVCILGIAVATVNRIKGNKTSGITSGLIFLGVLVGGLLGFLLRPSAPLVGQLPLMTVLTRGMTLSGLDQILIPMAQTSFNYVVVGMILGGVGGGITGLALSRGKSKPVLENRARYSSAQPKSIELGQTAEQVRAVLGDPEKIISLGQKVIYVYHDMKIVLMEGKVADVQ